MLGLNWILLCYSGQQLERKLGEYLDKKKYETLIELVKHKNAIVRVKLLERLEGLNDNRAVVSIEKILTHYDPSIRRIAMRALDKFVTDMNKKSEICIKSLDTRHVDIESWAVQNLRRMSNNLRVKNALLDLKRFVVLTSSGEESNDYDDARGTHTVYSELGIVTRAEAREKKGHMQGIF